MLGYFLMLMQGSSPMPFTCPLPMDVPKALYATPPEELWTRLAQATVVPPETMKRAHTTVMNRILPPLRDLNPSHADKVTRIVDTEAQWMTRRVTETFSSDFSKALNKNIANSDLPRLVAFYESPERLHMEQWTNAMKANPSLISEADGEALLECVAAMEKDSGFTALFQAGVEVMSSDISVRFGDELAQRITAQMKAANLRLPSNP